MLGTQFSTLKISHLWYTHAIHEYNVLSELCEVLQKKTKKTPQY